jgi:hypothetical protein
MVRSGLVKGDYNIPVLGLDPMANRIDVDWVLDQRSDALVLCTTGALHPALFPHVRVLMDADVPVFLHGTAAINKYESGAKLRAAEDHGLVLLNTLPYHYRTVRHGLERIFDEESTLVGRLAQAKDTFSHPGLYKNPRFLQLMINPVLKKLADGLPRDASPIVIDCGHIDSPIDRPTDADRLTFEEGCVLMRYLQQIGHEDVKLGFLYNELYALQKDDDIVMRIGGENATRFYSIGSKQANRRYIARLRRDIKRNGFHSAGILAYGDILDSYGITKETWPDSLVCVLEGSLNFQGRQRLAAYDEGSDHPFQVELEDYGHHGFSFRGSDGKERVIASGERGAPFCSLISAGLNDRYSALGVNTVIYLRDEKWRSAIRCGAQSGRDLYGAKPTVHAAFYATAHDKVGIVEGPVEL